jgi:hypothetical protein
MLRSANTLILAVPITMVDGLSAHATPEPVAYRRNFVCETTCAGGPPTETMAFDAPLANALASDGRLTEARAMLARAHGVNPALTLGDYAAQFHRWASSPAAAAPNLAGLRELGAV